MRLPVTMINDCWEYVVEVEMSLTREKAMRSVSVESELVPIFLVSDTATEATENQCRTSDSLRIITSFVWWLHLNGVAVCSVVRLGRQKKLAV